MPTQTSTRHSEVKSTPILSADGAFFSSFFFPRNWTKCSWIRFVSMAACSELGSTCSPPPWVKRRCLQCRSQECIEIKSIQHIKHCYCLKAWQRTKPSLEGPIQHHSFPLISKWKAFERQN